MVLFPVSHSTANLLWLEEESSSSLFPFPHTGALPLEDKGPREGSRAPTKELLRNAIASQLPCHLGLLKATRIKGLFYHIATNEHSFYSSQVTFRGQWFPHSSLGELSSCTLHHWREITKPKGADPWSMRLRKQAVLPNCLPAWHFVTTFSLGRADAHNTMTIGTTHPFHL